MNCLQATMRAAVSSGRRTAGSIGGTARPSLPAVQQCRVAPAAPATLTAVEPCISGNYATYRNVALPISEPSPQPRLVISDASTRFMVQAEVAAQLRSVKCKDGEGPRNVRLLRNSDGSNIAMALMLYSVSPGVYAHAVYTQARQSYQQKAASTTEAPAKRVLAHSA